MRTIAATTWAEYKQYFEKDAALSRRFQVVKVEEPTEEVAVDMLRAMIPVMQQHFKLQIDDEAIVTAVHSSHRYISGRQLPDKAISVLDTAAARVALTQNAQPVKLDQLKAQEHNLKLEQQILENEHRQIPIHHERLEALKANLESLQKEIQQTEEQWQKELELVHKIQELEAQNHANESEAFDQINLLRKDLADIQGQQPLVFERVNSQIINEIISDWTGIPVGKMVNDEIKQILTLEDKLGERVMGQDYALTQLVQGIKTSKAKLEDPNKPQGVFLLVGPSGVGKTETALTLANELYGGEQHLITINMSEYQEAHTVSSLKGAPLSTSVQRLKSSSTKSSEYWTCVPYCFSILAVILPNLCLIIRTSRSSCNGKYGTILIRPKNAGLNCLYKLGFKWSINSSAVGQSSTGVFKQACMIALEPALEVNKIVVFLKSITRPSPSSKVPLSNT